MADYDSISSKANSWWNRLSDSEQQLYQHNYYPDLDFKDVASNISFVLAEHYFKPRECVR